MKQFEEHRRLIEEIATACADAADRSVGKNGWEKIIHDVRFEPDGSGWMTRTVVRGPRGRSRIAVPDDVGDAEEQLWSLRKLLPNSKWFGFLVLITGGGEVETSYSYDPDCLDTFTSDETSRIPF